MTDQAPTADQAPMAEQAPMTSDQLVATLNAITVQIQNLNQNQQEILQRVVNAESNAAAAAGAAAGAAAAADGAARPARAPPPQTTDRDTLETLKAGRALLGAPPDWDSHGDKSVRFWADAFLAHAQNTAIPRFLQGQPALLLIKNHVDQDTQTWIENNLATRPDLGATSLSDLLQALVVEYTDVARYQRAYQAYAALTAQPTGQVTDDCIKIFNAEFNARAQRVNREAASTVNELSPYQQLQQYAQMLPAIIDESHVQFQTLITSDVTTTAFHEFQRAAEVRFKAWYAKYIKEHGVRTPPKTLLAPLSGATAGTTATSSLPAAPGPTAMDIGVTETDEEFAARVGLKPAGGYLKKLTPDDKKRCMRLGLCFRCRQPGHRAVDCPLREQGNGKAPGQ